MRIGHLTLTHRGDRLVLVAAITVGALAGLYVHHIERGLHVQTHLPSVLYVNRPAARVGVASSTRGPLELTTATRAVPASHRSHRSARSSRSYARSLVVDSKQFTCLNELWQRESHWNPKADNPHSTAYGIPQLLNLSSHVSPTLQVKAGLLYISHRYGTPCNALTFHNRHGWY